MEAFHKRHRLDLKTVEYRRDPETGEVYFRAQLDPARYSQETINGEQVVIDHQDHLLIPVQLVQDLIAKSLAQTPVGRQQELGNASEYVEGRKGTIRELLSESSQPLRLADPSADLLASIMDGIHPFAVLSVDIVGSTKLSADLEPAAYAKIMVTAQTELAAICPYFHGHVLKFTGDGILAYFPADAFLSANDNALDCALTMRLLIRRALNPILGDLGKPSVEIRIGVESGAAMVTTLGDPSTKSQRDLIGRTLSMACKIQASGHPGQIRLGQIAYQNLHTDWKKGCVSVPMPETWDHKLTGNQPYGVYSFDGGDATQGERPSS